MRETERMKPTVQNQCHIDYRDVSREKVQNCRVAVSRALPDIGDFPGEH